MKYPNILEEELKIRVGQEWFDAYDTASIHGKVDFAVEDKQDFLGESISYLWAEAKRGRSQRHRSIVQLILTIGKARLMERRLPPPYLGAFDAEGISFVPYHKVQAVFMQNDFNWQVTPSDHETKEFRQLEKMIETVLREESLVFDWEADARELKLFIRRNFTPGKRSTSKIHITKNNFTAIYYKWAEVVKPTINVDWESVKRKGILDGDFFLADLLSQEDKSLIEKLFVVLETYQYVLDRNIDDDGFFSSRSAGFIDGMQAYKAFWNKYERPPHREYWDYIIQHRHLLVPQDVRERKGSYFTPKPWVELSQQYIADVLGENWQDEYYVWDCAAGTGNLLVGLTEKHRIFASTLDVADVRVMHERAESGANLLSEHVFQFDFLNDEFGTWDEKRQIWKKPSKLPQDLLDIINDPEKRRKLVMYINPPYAEATNARQLAGTGANKAGTAVGNRTNLKYKALIGPASQELYAQFLIRIYSELPICKIAEFSTLKTLQSCNSSKFRAAYRAKLEKIFIVPGNTFDNVKGQFPIGFKIWDTEKEEVFKEVETDVYTSDGYLGKKKIYATEKALASWLVKDKINPRIGIIYNTASDFQHQKLLRLENNLPPRDLSHSLILTQDNLLRFSIFFAVRWCMAASWYNDRDQFEPPTTEAWREDKAFHADCLTFLLFHPQNRIRSAEGVNHWIPFLEKEVDAPGLFESHWMTDFISGRMGKKHQTEGGLLFGDDAPLIPTEPMRFGPEARAVWEAGHALWQYFHKRSRAVGEPNANASLYDIREYFQGRNERGKMNNSSSDPHYNELIAAQRLSLRELARHITPKVYDYGFLRR